jgi:hypothetical protein
MVLMLGHESGHRRGTMPWYLCQAGMALLAAHCTEASFEEASFTLHMLVLQLEIIAGRH